MTMGLLLAACAPLVPDSLRDGAPEPEVLYVLADGTMKLNERVMNPEDVVIYADGRGGERAAVKLRLPLHSDVYRDTITVERAETDVPVVRRK